MARMFPPVLDPDTKSAAERRLYEIFAYELSDDWSVFHSVRWISRSDRGRTEEGEADFVVAHPGLGILVIEVKGGRIHLDPQTGHFISTDRKQSQHDIDDPFQQATTSKHTLITKLKSTRGWPTRRVIFGHAVAFPDQVAQEGWARPNAPRDIIIDALDLVSLEVRLRAVFAFWRGQSGGDIPPGPTGVQILHSLLAQSLHIRNPLLAESTTLVEHELVRLTERQYRYLLFLRGRRRAAIAGCAGSGKTFLAVEKARQLAVEGLRVLYTCYNRPLADHLGETLGYRSQFDVFSFHQLCVHWASEADQRLVYREDAPPSYFNVTLPDALMSAISRLGGQYDAIIVDEGQDFRQEWWDVLPWLLHDPENDILYIFFDDNQRIYRERSPIPMAQEPFVLYENCRNTQRIFKIVGSFYIGEQLPTVLGPEGQPVEIIRYHDARDSEDKLRRLLHRLTTADGFAHDQIVVLSALGEATSALIGRRFGNIQLTSRQPLGSGEIYATTVRRFKGLDRSAVVLCDIDRRMSAEDVETLMYVGTSRAKGYLALLIGDDPPTAIQEALGTLLE